ncbi:DEAD/DEAH box helicase [Aestuariimicrobium kwangyangense]|uniref:DEAD/DEAH box helicase n=1 Tax=Aestuariimicrobium kwangyangense TaxID=396389 RepID=UPI0003B5718F
MTEPVETRSTQPQQWGPLLREFVTRYSFALDDYQLEACAKVEDGAGVLVAAPTGAGKTVVGEFAVFCAVERGTKCFYTTPIKALSNQKFHDLEERYGSERVGLLTGDTTINGEAQVVVMTTEVLRNMIYAESPTLANLGYVVMDEVHYLADRFRGAVWEEVILGLAPDVQVVSLSATVSNAEEFGDWLDEVRGRVDVVLSERRPVPLFQHVMVGRRLHDLFDGDAPTALAMPARRASDVNPELLSISKQEARAVRDDSRNPRSRSGRGKRKAGYGSGSYGGAAHGSQTQDSQRRLTPRRDGMVELLAAAELLPAICFIFSRQGCDAAVRQLLHSNVRLTTAREARELREICERHVGGMPADDLRALEFDVFVEALARGIAAHHAGILPAFKAVVEEGFAAGLIKVVFATETLALGINMPARTVVLEKLVKYNGQAHVDITPGEYTQLTGRAGRRGIDVEGHAVVLWQPGLDPRAVAGLASRRTYPLRSSFSPTYNMAVNMVGRVGRSKARVLLEQSFAQFQTDRNVVGIAREAERTEQVVAEHLKAAQCDRGDFVEYARMRDQVSQLEAEAARGRKSDLRAEAMESLFHLEAGDLIWVPGGKHAGWAVVVDPGRSRSSEPTPMVMTEGRELTRLSLKDFPQPTAAVGKVRIPKKFDPRVAHSRKALVAALLDRVRAQKPVPPQFFKPERDEEIATEVAELRLRLRAHPCHGCPDRELHARHAEQALRMERDLVKSEARMARRTATIAAKFDRICTVLTSLGYLDADDPDLVTADGKRLSRIYSELDLVAAECLREGVFDGLEAPQLAAVLSSLVYESRREASRVARMPDRASESAQHEVRQVWRRVSLVERDQRLDPAKEPDIGFAEAAHAWATGAELADVLEVTGLPAGDFVRWVRQVIDMAGQVADAAGPGDVRRRARQIVELMRRGVIQYDPDED